MVVVYESARKRTKRFVIMILCDIPVEQIGDDPP
jgi:hypothetical protein